MTNTGTLLSMLLLWISFSAVKGQVFSIEAPEPCVFEKEKVIIQSIGNPGQAQQIPQSLNPLAHIPGVSGLPKAPSAWVIDQHTATANDPLAQYKKDLAEYNLRQQKNQTILEEIYRDIEKSTIRYGFPTPNTALQKKFENALLPGLWPTDQHSYSC